MDATHKGNDIYPPVEINISIFLRFKKNKDFNEVLNDAKKKGYAEANPSADLNGDDVSAKLKILSSLCFNSFLNHNIHVEGIKNIDKNDIINANKLGYKVKLLGYAEFINDKIYQRVHPTLIKKSSYVASIDGVLNAVIIDGKTVGQTAIQGEGAGPSATTSALISDISSIKRIPLVDFSKAPYEIDPLFFSSPNNSNSYFFISNKAPFKIINGPVCLLDCLCIFLAISSLPDPVGPFIKTLLSETEILFI